MGRRMGITAAGNWIVDKTKIIDDYPHQDGLSNIISQSEANGGSPYNILKNLSKLGVDFPLAGIGVVGDDENGTYILEDCLNHTIDISRIVKTPHANTSYTDVMSSQKTGRRTFFHHRGANSLLSLEHFDIPLLTCKIFHLGYLLLLDGLDEFTESGETKAANLLRQIRNEGIKVSVDIVSENSDRFQSVVSPSIAHIDYLFVNEFEASKITNTPLSSGDNVKHESLVMMAEKLIALGVNEYVFLHFPGGAIAMDRERKVWRQSKVMVPQKEVKGTSGAGDAFAAGVLYGLYQDLDIQKILQLGVSVAAVSLFHPTCSEAITSVDSILETVAQLGFDQQ